MEHGHESKPYQKFKRVFSGHYHTRSDDGKIFYLGNPYEIYWNDANDTRGFHIFDTKALKHTPVDNPYKMFYNIYYEDTDYQMFDVREYENKIVKVIVRKKTDSHKFEKFIDKLYSAGVSDLKIVEKTFNYKSQRILKLRNQKIQCLSLKDILRNLRLNWIKHSSKV